LRTRLDAEKLVFDERTRGCFINLPASECTHGFWTLLAFDAARIEPERFKSKRGQIGSEEINCLEHLFHQRKLQRGNVLALQQRQYLLFGSKQLLFVDRNLPARHNHDLDMRQPRRVHVLCDMDMGDHARIFRLIQHGLNRFMSHMDELPRGCYSRQGYCCRQHLARHGHTAQFLLPALDSLSDHMLATLVNEGSIAQRSWKRSHHPHYFGTRARSGVKYDNRDGFVARVRYGERCTRIRCSHQMMHRLCNPPFSNLLTVCKMQDV